MGLLMYPDPLFAYELRVDAVVLHARHPLPPRAAEVARSAHQRVAASPFFVPGDVYHVFLCDSPELFALFAALHPGVGGIAHVGLNGNVFLRPSRVESDRLLGPRGGEVPGERTLTYFVAHEVTHSMVARRLGRIRYHLLEPWQQEGYADHVGKAGAFDFEATRLAFLDGAPELDPTRSGLYLRYHLLVAYALGPLGLSPEALLASPRDSGPLEAALRELAR